MSARLVARRYAKAFVEIGISQGDGLSDSLPVRASGPPDRDSRSGLADRHSLWGLADRGFN